VREEKTTESRKKEEDEHKRLDKEKDRKIVSSFKYQRIVVKYEREREKERERRERERKNNQNLFLNSS